MGGKTGESVFCLPEATLWLNKTARDPDEMLSREGGRSEVESRNLEIASVEEELVALYR